jgi:hypothetical protein
MPAAAAEELGDQMNEITIDGITIPAVAYLSAEKLADETRRTHFVGYVWEVIPGDPYQRHRTTDSYLITSNRDAAKASCGAFVWVPPMRVKKEVA